MNEPIENEWENGKRSVDCYEREIADLKQQRDDLLEALKQISDIEDARFTHAGFDLEVNNIAKATIAKVS